LRIIGGTHKGRRIEVFRGFEARPTTDFAKEALFNILDNRISYEEVVVLDLFSGTGSLSYEFASRGCSLIDSVDIQAKYIHFIRRCATEMGFHSIHPVRMDVSRFLQICRRRYDVVFADPPFDLKWLDQIPGLLRDASVLKDGGLFILEHSKLHHFRNDPWFSEERLYGQVHFTFFNSAEKIQE